MKTIIAIICITCTLSAHAKNGFLGPTANQLLHQCKYETSNDDSFCTGYFDGYLDGLVYGTAVDWNLPQNQSLSAQTIRNSLIKLLGDKPILGDQPIGVVTILGLVSQGIVKEKNPKVS